MPSYSSWPVVADVQMLLDACAVDLRLTGADATTRIQRLIDDVAAEVGRDTLRQFIVDSSDTTRTYDGSGTPEQEVDEMVTLTGVTVIGVANDPGYTLSPVLASDYERPKTRLILGRGSLPAWQTSGILIPSQNVFPAGRQNIQVTGKFGYASAIPKDLWESVAGEVALRLSQEVAWRPIGSVIEQETGDTKVKYKPSLPWATGWHDRYRQALKRYRRPSGRRLRQMRPPMV